MDEQKGMTLTQALARAMDLWGPLGAARETRACGTRVRVCEVGHQPLDHPEWWAQPMVVLGRGSSWVKAFADADERSAHASVS